MIPMFGIVNISDSCIFFTDESKIKVWASPHIADVPLVDRKNQLSEKMVIRSIIELIERKCFNQKIFYALKKAIDSGAVKIYSQAIREVSKIASSLFIEIEDNIPHREPSHKFDGTESRFSSLSNYQSQFSNSRVSQYTCRPKCHDRLSTQENFPKQ